MKSKHFIYPAVIVLALLVPVARYYASTPELNACVSDYVEEMKYSNNKWLIYKINGNYHIETDNSDNNRWLDEYLVWKSIWCMMFSDNLLNDLNNTVYCSITYMIKNAPVHDNVKKQLALLKTP